jgi:hypothetical protein
MRRHISFCLAIVLITLGLPAKTYAATDGCPDTWLIDTSQYPSKELDEAKMKLGQSMVKTIVSQKVIEYKGALGVLPRLETDLLPRHPMYSYLYGHSIVETDIKVEVRNCSKPQLFKFRHGLYQPEGYNPGYISRPKQWKTMRVSEWIQEKTTRGKFVDFKKEESFPKYLEDKKSQIQEMVNKSKRDANPKLTTQVMMIEDTDENGLNGFSLSPTALSENCVRPPTVQGRYPDFIFGKKCDFAWIYTSYEADVILESFTLDLTMKSNSITCIKGKTTKKVSGTNPKCPKGYKKAS